MTIGRIPLAEMTTAWRDSSDQPLTVLRKKGIMPISLIARIIDSCESMTALGVLTLS
ncbi:MAG: hypothetical protein KIG64_00535 [Bacteroidales bacterium]|nr:hypothetical protein [Bacteroidales bacterium]